MMPGCARHLRGATQPTLAAGGGEPSRGVAARTALGGSPVPHIIVEPCIGTKDQACVDVCPVECIYEADDQFYIHPEECIDCGACVPACPVQAIFPEEDVPEQWASFIQKNYDLSGV
jgi:NAD-dependent dihydropyrimidine dehydrogenase PreA subunit